MNILIVDDYSMNRKLLRAELEAVGESVCEAEDGSEALAMLETQPVDAIVSDILMPNMDGYRFCYEVRHSPRFQHLPFVFYTSTYGSPDDEKLARDIGGDAFITKPAGAGRVLEALRENLSSPRLKTSIDSGAPGELEVMKSYSERLVAKLEERNAELHRRTAELEREIADRQLAQKQVHENLELAERSRSALLSILEDQQRAETAQRASEQTLQRTLDAAHIGHWNLNLITHAASRSLRHEQIFGYEELLADWSYEKFLIHVHAEDRARVDRLFQAGVAAKSQWDFECRITRHDGALRWIWVHGSVFTNPAGEPERMLGMVTDITERKQAERQLKEYTGRLEHLSRQLLVAQETERRHIARELHDEIGQLLTVVKLDLQTVLRQTDTQNLNTAVGEGMESIDRVIARVRDLSLDLRPSLLDDFGLVPALRWLVQRQTKHLNAHIDLDLPDNPPRFSGTVETACFRIAQEALTNILRYAQAKQIQVTLRLHAQHIEVSVMDDGVGFDLLAMRGPDHPGAGFGLLGMRERAELAGGEFEIISAPGQGCCVIARFPWTTENEREP